MIELLDPACVQQALVEIGGQRAAQMIVTESGAQQ
jgi:hypothetical protein